jgi:CRISPR-associated protein Csx10
MKSFHFRLTCQDDIVLSQSAATTGGHRSLDYIPGATLLGASAALLYTTLGPDAFDVYHAGKVRFGNALPVTEEGEAAFPVPLAWHHAKGVSVADQSTGSIDTAAVFNFAHQSPGFPQDQQPKQLRVGFITGDARLLAVHHGFRLKTAIDRKRGAAAESQLFGYESIRAGTRFAARVDFDDDISSEITTQVIATLTGVLRIGRSRGAQYGRVLCEKQEPIGEPVSSPARGRLLTVWLLSDLVVVDPLLGQPTFAPRPEWLGLPAGRLLARGCFMQTRRYSPYHSIRRAYDIERQAIRQGSVLTFELDQDLDPDSWESVVADARRGLGLYREQGLGQVWLNPPLLDGAHPVRGAAISARNATPDLRGPAPTGLTRWLVGARGRDDKTELQEWAKDCADEALELYRSIARFDGLQGGDLLLAGPSLSQWGRLEQVAKEKGADFTAIHNALFTGDSAICKQNDEQWKRVGTLNSIRLSFRAWLMARLGNDLANLLDQQKLATGRTVALLAESVRRRLNDSSTGRNQ